MLSIEMIFREANGQPEVWRTSVGKYLETRVSMDMPFRSYLDMGVTDLVVRNRTKQLRKLGN